MPQYRLSKRVVAEFAGTAFLVAAVVGSGIMAERLSAGNVGIALLANTLATGAALVALIFTFGSISGAHLNPVVSLADALERGLPWHELPSYIVAQLLGGVIGTAVAHLMFALPLFSLSHHVRTGRSQVFSEFIATFGLVGHLGLFKIAGEQRSLCRGRLYHRSVLVHSFDFVRKSGGHNCACSIQHLLGDPSY